MKVVAKTAKTRSNSSAAFRESDSSSSEAAPTMTTMTPADSIYGDSGNESTDGEQDQRSRNAGTTEAASRGVDWAKVSQRRKLRAKADGGSDAAGGASASPTVPAP